MQKITVEEGPCKGNEICHTCKGQINEGDLCRVVIIGFGRRATNVFYHMPYGACDNFPQYRKRREKKAIK